MVTFKTIVIAVLLISSVVFVALFGRLPAFRKTPIGAINRLIWVKIPGVLLVADRCISGGRFTWFLKHLGDYLMNENHPLVLAFFLFVLFGSVCTFLSATWQRLGNFHRAVVVIFVTAPALFTYKSVRSQASVITQESHWKHMRQYPYDHVLFHPGQICRTCRLIKPARSKHCKICKVCVAKQDHHCIWVMNCLGRGNYCYFVAMLVSLALLLSYGAYLGYMLLDEDLQQSAARAFSAGPTSGRWSDGTTFSQKVDKWIWAFATNIRVGCIGLLAVFTAPLAWGLFLYHVYLIWAGTTTNESFKWDDWKYDIADGHVYICHGPAKPALPNKDPEVEPEVDWPVSTSQRLANRALGQSLEQQGQSAAQEAGWTRVRDLSEVTNLYDLGLWHNLLDIFRVS